MNNNAYVIGHQHEAINTLSLAGKHEPNGLFAG